jgi:hypothetical protein
MTRSILCGLLGLISIVTLGTLPVACQSGGVGDPCTPEDEFQPDFAGFKMTEENIESRSFQCATRICLVNHFQGRVSCPLGQPGLDAPGSTRKACDPDPAKMKTCDPMTDGECVAATTFVLDCNKDEDCSTIPGLKCDTTAKLCTCDDATELPPGYVCAGNPDKPKEGKFLKTFACHKKDNCQHAEDKPDQNAGKDCCVPGTDDPVAASVCGQCDSESKRGAEQAVYCSCRCGVAENEKEEDSDFNFCTCPSGFTCSEIRPNVGLGDPQITGKYCIKEKTEFNGDRLECKEVAGHWDATCDGTPSITSN